MSLEYRGRGVIKGAPHFLLEIAHSRPPWDSINRAFYRQAIAHHPSVENLFGAVTPAIGVTERVKKLLAPD